ncbi:MAG: aminodeoxychorismate/anthranilate synthase component II [Bdellovibrionota bacterium]
MILLIDNYDSFTFNLLQYLGEVTAERIPIEVRRNDSISIADIEALAPSHIVISPGPCTPNEAGISLDVFRVLAPKYPILGVCLGHQALGQAFGGKVIRAAVPTHGKTGQIHHTGKGIFRHLASPFSATRYHSLIVDRDTLPSCLEITAELESGEVMGLRHRSFPQVCGVQFHPESILTQCGKQLLRNFVVQDDDAVLERSGVS